MSSDQTSPSPDVTDAGSTAATRTGKRVERRQQTKDNNKRNRWLIGGAAAVVVAGVVVWVVSTQSGDDGAVPQPTGIAPVVPTSSAPPLVPLGERSLVTLANGAVLDITTNNGTWHSDGDPAPAGDNQYLVFEMSVTQVSGPETSLSASQFTVRWMPSARPNTTPSEEAGGHVTNPFPFGQMSPGTTLAGQVSFQVPSTEDVVLRFADVNETVLARWEIPQA